MGKIKGFDNKDAKPNQVNKMFIIEIEAITSI
jgi:hypothetical protein